MNIIIKNVPIERYIIQCCQTIRAPSSIKQCQVNERYNKRGLEGSETYAFLEQNLKICNLYLKHSI